MMTNYNTIRKIGCAGLLALSTLNLAQAQTKTVVINKSVKYQKIDGFGAYGLAEVAWGSPPYYSPDFVKTTVEDLGLTISRAEAYPMEETNDNNNPFVTDFTKFKPSAFNTAYYQFAKEAQALAKTYGDTIKFMYTVWTPPAWCKYTNTENGLDPIWNRLIAKDFTPPGWNTFDVTKKPAADPDDMKDEFIEHSLAHIKLFKEKSGLDLYAFSLQNELAFPEPYNSCIYSPEQYRELVKVAGPRFRKNAPETKLLMPEDIGDLGRYSDYLYSIGRDTEAVKYLDIAACHAYNATGTLAGSTSATTWDGMYRVSNRYKKTPFWQTETSGYGLGWDGGMSLAKAMYVGLKFGKVSAWIWWQIASKNEDESEYELFTFTGKKYKRYFTVKHFARYVRPNSVSVEATCAADADILPLAFQHDAKKTLTVILINQATSEKKIKLNFADASITPVNYKMYLTNATNDCADMGSIAAGSEITLPANSLTTLMGEGSMPIITSNDEAQESKISFTVYPNPANNVAYVEFQKNMSTTVEIKDAYSKVIKSIPTVFMFGSYTMQFDTEDLANGMYLVQIGNQAKKLVINR